MLAKIKHSKNHQAFKINTETPKINSTHIPKIKSVSTKSTLNKKKTKMIWPKAEIKKPKNLNPNLNILSIKLKNYFFVLLKRLKKLKV